MMGRLQRAVEATGAGQHPVPHVAIHCQSVTKSYGKGEAAVRALRGVDLDVRPGELMMLKGPSGSGKTTLISILGGLTRRDTGTCLVLGQDYVRMTPREIVRFRGSEIGFVFQTLHLIPSLDATENAAVPLLIAREKRPEALRQAASLLAHLGFDARLRKARPTELSGGQRQRVAIARAMVHNPSVIFCDEPTSALDGEAGHAVMELLRETVLTENRTLVVVTHDERVLGFADRIAHMEDGRIHKIDTPNPQAHS